MTEHVKVLNDLELHGAFIMPDDNADFPLNPALGTFVIKDRCLYGYLRIGGMETWYPFASKTNSYIHTQGLPALTWTVTHNLGTSNVWIQVKDDNGNIVGVGKTDVSDNQFQLNFTSAIKGTVVVVAPDSVDVPVVKASLIQVGANVEINTTGVLINGQYALTAANISTEIQAAIDAVVAGAPGALDTLNELAAAIGNDADYAATIVNALASKADIVSVDAQIAVVSAEAALAASVLQTDLTALTNTVSDKADLSYVTAQLATQQAALSGVYTSPEVDAALALKANTSSLATVATSGSYADLSNKPAIPSVPTAVSAFTNDSGYQTAAQVSIAITTANLASASGSATHNFAVKDLSVYGDIMPAVPGVSKIGDADHKFGSVYTKELHIDANTLYVDGVPVLGSSANTINFTADDNQGMRIATTGSGALTLDSQAATTIGTSGANADVIIQSTGTGGLTRLSSVTQVTLTAPTVAIAGNQTVSGSLVVAGDFTVSGAHTIVNSTSMTVEDNIVTLNKGEPTDGITLDSAGIEIDRGALARQRLIYKQSSDKWLMGAAGSEIAVASESYVTSAISGKANSSSLATVATSGSYTDLSNKPTLFSGVFADLTSKPTTLAGYGVIDAAPLSHVSDASLHLTAAQNTWLDAVTATSAEVNYLAGVTSAVQTQLNAKAASASLATVATSGSYTDLTNKPSIPSKVSDLTNDSGFQTSAQVTSAIQAVVGAAPAALDTLVEIATQLASDESAVAALTTTVSGKANSATTLSGYGITDAYTKIAVDTALSGKANTATTLAGYGITLTSLNVTTALGYTPYNPTTALSGGTF